jgi:hypothetical protein
MQSLGIGLGQKIKKMIARNDEYDYEDFYRVWEWALDKNKNFVFPYIVSMNGKKWVDGTTIDVSDGNNELLWISIMGSDKIEGGNIHAVKALLTVPGLFRKEILTLEQGTTELEGEFVERGDTKRPMRATNFGVFVNNAKDKEMEDLLLNYYNNELRKIGKSA